MARIIPDGWEALDFNGSALREIETLRLLATLPDDCTVMHGVHWTRIEHGCSVYGEIDFIVIAPNGRVLLIEQKSGLLDETPDGLVKAYGALKKRVASQILRSIDALTTRYAQSRRGKAVTVETRLSIDYLLFCPDYHVRDARRAGIAAERIVDASRGAQLVAIVADLLGPTPVAGSADAATALRFFSDQLLMVADVGTLIGRTDAWVTRLSGGLAKTANQLDFSPFRLRVRGTAGSGKTQLALRVLHDAADAGLSALYLCYNRPLADHVARIAPHGVTIATFHGFGDRLLKAAGRDPDFAAPGLYDRLETAVIDARPEDGDRYDVVIVDEGQDFTAAWRDGALRFLRPGGRAYWLEDPLQNLYGREPVALYGWVTLHANVNYRSPRDIVDTIVPLLTRGTGGPVADALRAIEAASPLSGSELDITTWNEARDDDGGGETATRALFDATMRAITKALAAGYRRSDIVLLTFAGREHSRLLALDALGPHALRRFAGSYDLFGNPVYSEGEVLAETIYRFKGQSAPCVIFSEIDFETLDEKAVRKLFVGATRATTRLMLVMSERAARVCLVDRAGAH
ncbi:MAG: ATP-binding domain-containing protein [Burkholderiaceae bacterium]